MALAVLGSTDDEAEDMLRTLAWPGERHRAYRVWSRVAEYREFQDGELISGTRYRVVGLVGVGGMGTVYEVEHVELGKRFVLKALLRELSRRQDLVIRLRNEWRALGRLEHPNIVTVTDAGTTDNGVPFFVMERLEGETLSQRMRRTRRFPVREALDIAAGVLEGLAAAHQIGVVHRDVKPPNIFVLADGRPKVLDFGVAKILDDPGVVTARGVAVGTPRYMSPEQARGDAVDGRADIYSVGLILFEIVAGVSPFDDARDANELILAHLAKRPPLLSTLAMGIPPELDAAVTSMLAKRREDRPVTALEAARRLREISAANARSSRTPPPLVIATNTGERPPNAAAEVDTTRPDGVASKPRATLSSMTASEPLSWLERPTLRQTTPVTGARSGSWSRASDTLIGLPPDPSTAAPPLTSTQPLVVPTPSGSERIKTEVLTAIPEPEPDVTRTRNPGSGPRPPLGSWSETPPPVTPSKDLRAAVAAPEATRSRSGWVALGVVSLLVMVGLAVLATQPRPSARPAADLRAQAARPPAPAEVPAALPLASAASTPPAAPSASAAPTALPDAMRHAAPKAATRVRSKPHSDRETTANLTTKPVASGAPRRAAKRDPGILIGSGL